MTIFLRGFIIGFSIAAPVGPIGMLCIRRTLADGRLTGLLTGFGAATADMLYCGIAAFGLTFVMEFVLDQVGWLRIIGGLFLLYLGINTFLTKPAEEAAKHSRSGLFGAYLSTFLLTITNPITILSFLAIFAGLRLAGSNGSYSMAALMVIGVFLGSAAWWLTLSSVVAILRARFTTAWMVWVNRVSGLIITGFGIVALLVRLD
jgi:threonine/homoserine/homoserine lactone efflux protein